MQQKIYFTDSTYKRMFEDGYLGNANIIFEKALNRKEIYDIRKIKSFYIVDEDLKQRIDKAIEYIERNCLEFNKKYACQGMNNDMVDKLLDILKGSDKD